MSLFPTFLGLSLAPLLTYQSIRMLASLGGGVFRIQDRDREDLCVFASVLELSLSLSPISVSPSQNNTLNDNRYT